MALLITLINVNSRFISLTGRYRLARVNRFETLPRSDFVNVNTILYYLYIYIYVCLYNGVRVMTRSRVDKQR